jgi:hypothetical protein
MRGTNATSRGESSFNWNLTAAGSEETRDREILSLVFPEWTFRKTKTAKREL